MRALLFRAVCLVSGLLVVTCGGNVVVDSPAATGARSGNGGVPSSGLGGGGQPGCLGLPGECGGNTGVGGGPLTGCTSDADCAAGAVCDTATGECVTGPAESCQQCACTDLGPQGGCGDICDMAKNGTMVPNFCNGVAALPQCANCLEQNCSGLATPPVPTDPSACM
jgi:Cys-rich repeat protein